MIFINYYQKMRRFIILSILFCVITYQASLSFAADIPSWFINAESSNSQGDLFGYANSSSLKLAKDAALADIASYLFTNISAQSRSEQQITRAEEIKQKSSFSQYIKTTSRPLVVEGSEVEKSELVDKQYYVKLKVSGTALAQLNLDSIKELNKKLNISLADLELGDKNIETRLKLAALAGSYPQVRESMQLLGALQNIKPNLYFNQSDYDQTILEYENNKKQAEAAVNELVFFVDSPQQELAPFKNETLTLLSALGVKPVTSLSDSQPTVILALSGEVLSEKAYGADLALINLEINLSYSGRKLGSKTYSLRHFSPFSAQNALSSAAIKWGKSFENTSIITALSNE